MSSIIPDCLLVEIFSYESVDEVTARSDGYFIRLSTAFLAKWRKLGQLSSSPSSSAATARANRST
ncbi:hypothetical protein [Sinorhizobium fredii]|uniref:hypothetical protein n=1 Tax=Rhizobium fredii TaxID=380 RepID=UPI00339322AA